MAILGIWETMLASERPDLGPRIQRSEEKTIEVALTEEMEHWLVHPSARRTTVEDDYHVTSSADLRLYQTRPSDAFLSNFNGLLALAHDLQEDESGGGNAEFDFKSPSESWFTPWPASSLITLLNDQLVQLDWPVPLWHTFLDWHEAEKQWNIVSKFVRKNFRQTVGSGTNKALLTSLMHFVLRLVWSVSTNRSAGGRFDLSLNTREWEACGQMFIAEVRENHQDRRGQEVQRWCLIGAPLFAAPEFELPALAAKSFLKPWKEHFEHSERGGQIDIPNSSLPLHLRQEIQMMRREWLRQSLKNSRLRTDDATLKSCLEDIRQRNENHPWYEIIEPDTSGSEPTQPKHSPRRKGAA